ncbi:glycosyltransferase [Herbiconiux sp. P18]|uniref:glycosyltransferase n=1 Tax=Herbiconiux liangxiaofengii TaxID=3342795 RepID=UPI0035BA2E1A
MTQHPSLPIRVASVPASHPYVASIAPDAAVAQMLPDPVVPGRPAGQWWPPALFDPGYLRANAGGFDLVHVHFGMESVPTDQLVEALAVLREEGLPVVFTVHDLENPQLSDQSVHRAQLDLMMAEADELVTLTPGAAAQIQARWGRSATVIPHPRMARHRPVGVAAPSGIPRVGVHLRDLRPNIAAVETVGSVIEAVAALTGAGRPVRARIRMDHDVRDAGAAAVVQRLLRDADGVTLERGGRQTDAALEQWIADLDVAVLPYSHGTHSGWAELCYDLGVTVIDDGHGFAFEQLPAGIVRRERGIGAGGDLAGPLGAALDLATAPGTADRAQEVALRDAHRDLQSRQIADAHAEVYQRALQNRLEALGGRVA